VKAIAFSADGKILATGGEDKMIYLWDVQTGGLVATIRNAFTIKSLQFTGEGNLLAACGNDIILMDRQGQILRTFSGFTTDIWSFSYNPATRRIAAGSYGKTIRIWDFNSAKTALILEGHEKSCLPVCFDPAGKLIASGSLDKSVRIWDATSGAQISKQDIHSGNVFAIDFLHSGKYFASGSADKTIRLWNAENGKLVRTFVGHEGAVFDLQFSRDGLHMISCDSENAVILWETATGKRIHTFEGHAGPVNAARFNNDESGIATASDDHTVRYWMLDKKYFMAGTYYEKEIEKAVSASGLFAPRGADESKQEYTLRAAESSKYLDSLYDLYFDQYREMLGRISME
jgi:WD40 repeat protein